MQNQNLQRQPILSKKEHQEKLRGALQDAINNFEGQITRLNLNPKLNQLLVMYKNAYEHHVKHSDDMYYYTDCSELLNLTDRINQVSQSISKEKSNALNLTNPPSRGYAEHPGFFIAAKVIVLSAVVMPLLSGAVIPIVLWPLLIAAIVFLVVAIIAMARTWASMRRIDNQKASIFSDIKKLESECIESLDSTPIVSMDENKSKASSNASLDATENSSLLTDVGLFSRRSNNEMLESSTDLTDGDNVSIAFSIN